MQHGFQRTFDFSQIISNMSLRRQARHFFQYFLIKKQLCNLFKPNGFLLNTFF